MIEGTVRVMSYGDGQNYRISFSNLALGVVPMRNCAAEEIEHFLTVRLDIPAHHARTAISDVTRVGNGWIANMALNPGQLDAFDSAGVSL